MRHLKFLSIELIASLASDETYVLGLSLSLGVYVAVHLLRVRHIAGLPPSTL